VLAEDAVTPVDADPVLNVVFCTVTAFWALGPPAEPKLLVLTVWACVGSEIEIVWLCAGRFVVANVVVAEPPVAAKAYALPEPTGMRSVKFGRPNVVAPSPAPYVVLITANNAAYVERDTFAPSQNKYPLGAELVDHINIVPDGFPDAAAEVHVVPLDVNTLPDDPGATT
jgi:hypothetical protein